MNTIENLLSPVIKHLCLTVNIKHVFPTGILMIELKSDKNSLHFGFIDESFNLYHDEVKQNYPFVRKHLKKDLNKLMLFFENKDNFEFKRSDQGYSLELIKPFNLDFFLKKHFENKKKEEAELFRCLSIRLNNDCLGLGEKNISLKRKIDELEQENTSLKQEISRLKPSIPVSDSNSQESNSNILQLKKEVLVVV